MSVTEKEFEDELETFRVSVGTATQFFYAFQTIHFLSSQDKAVLSLLNQAPVFWNTNIGALREAMFISLGRIFDKDKRTHNVDKLLKVAQDTPELFKASAPRWCKQGDASKHFDYVASIYEPNLRDWLRLETHVSNWRKVYVANYQSIRDKMYGHRERISLDKKVDLFNQTNYMELEKLFAFLDALHEALWWLYYNGHKPVIRYRRRSLMQMFTSEIAGQRGLTAGELVAQDARKFLESHASRNRTKES